MEESASAVHLISVKPPIFSTETASSWFQILEARFHIAHISNSGTRYFHALAALPPDLIATVSPEVLDSKDFNILKSAILAEHERTKPELFEKLISTSTLHGRPSAFLNEISRTAGKLGIGDDLVRHKFLPALPDSITPVIASQKSLSLQQLGSLADELIPLLNKETVFAVRGEKSSIRRYGQDRMGGTIRKEVVLLSVLPFHSDQRP